MSTQRYNYGNHVIQQGRPIELKETLELTEQQLQGTEHVSAVFKSGSSRWALLVRTEDDLTDIKIKQEKSNFIGLFAISDELASKAGDIQ